jgi:hypothetical protein
MSIRCVFKNDKGEQCSNMVETGVLCAVHIEGQPETPNAANETPTKSGGGGGSGGWSILGRTGVVYQRED